MLEILLFIYYKKAIYIKILSTTVKITSTYLRLFLENYIVFKNIFQIYLIYKRLLLYNFHLIDDFIILNMC